MSILISKEMNYKNLIKNLLEPPKYHYSSKFLNKINFQKIRCNIENKKYKKNSLKFKPDRKIPLSIKKSIDTNGYVILENFFSSQDFNDLEKSFNSYSKSNRVNYQSNYYNMIWGSGLISSNSDKQHDADLIINLFNKKKTIILDIVSYILKKNITGELELSYQDLKLMDEREDDLDPNRLLHSDRHYHCAKAYFLIEDNHEFNSPYVYCPKSHLIDEKRINFENKISRYKSFNNIKYHISKNDLYNLGIQEKNIIASKNSLVISDNIGIHKRGKMLKGFTRKQIRISFHYLQANFLQKALRSIIRKIM